MAAAAPSIAGAAPPAADAPVAAQPRPATVEEVVVTAQRKREAAQTVPIAISAFSQKTLDAQKIEGGPDLLKAIPNVSFTKTNFSGYNLTIRGIGTQAVSVSTDPGVSVNFNGTALIRNRLFEQEFFDVERVEVLRGPQGTLYGRNATAGAVNVISAKPTDTFEGEIKAEAGTYGDRRISGFVNIPLVGDKLDLRVAGASTNRDGFAYNAGTGHDIDGRGLYSTRVTLGFKPTERLRGDLVWEHFNENDDRARSTKQLCTRDPGLSSIGSVQNLTPLASAFFSQGCQNASLYSPAAYGTPNGLSIPFVLAGVQNTQGLGYTPDTFTPINLLKAIDPYGGLMQSTDLREIASQFDPRYKANSDVFEVNLEFDVGDHLTLISQTAYDRDKYFSQEDYNRFQTVPGVFEDSAGLLNQGTFQPSQGITPGGVFCDPQLGCSTSIAGIDRSQARSEQFSQELRLQSSFAGPFNFSLGANYVHYRTIEDYYVFFNIISAIAESVGPAGNNTNGTDLSACNTTTPPSTITPTSNTGCIYIDPNKLSNVNSLGHNYFRSSNPYRLNSAAVFGEAYYKLTDNLRLTAGLRYTDDNKRFTPVPSQTLLAPANGGSVDGGYPSSPDIVQHWSAFTGRLAVDWTPKFSFTNQTLIYASYNRGYKGGGANPPSIGYTGAEYLPGLPPIATLISYPPTFAPEYVNAFEVGTKNTLLNGALVLNAGAFFYDYDGYQVSQIEDRTAINENFNAKIWGVEFESVWQATHHLRFNVNLGYQGSSIADGSKSIDVENRTQGNADYTTLKGIEFLPSNCVVSKSFVEQILIYNRSNGQPDDANLAAICPGTFFDLLSPLQPTAADLPNGGRGFYADLSGHDLPNQPHFTQSIGAEYDIDLPAGWAAALRGDVYHQSQSWARVYQDPIDKLRGWYNVNLRATVGKPALGLEFEVYVKNLFDDSPITGAFINSDDTALTTNVFTLDPRVVGASVRKRF